MNLVEGSMRRPVTVTMLTAAAVLFGLVALTRLPLNLLPDISYPTLTIRTEYSDAAPAEVEKLVTEPLEESVAVVRGLRSLRSVSRPGVSEITAEFGWKTKMDYAALDVREKIDLVQLPDDADAPVLLRFDPSLDPILRVGIYGDEDPVSLRHLADTVLKKDLESLEGVASVRVRGGLEEEIHVDVDEGKLAALGIPIATVSRFLDSQNVNAAGGKLRDRDSEFLVRTMNEFEDLDDLRQTILYEDGGRSISLADVADIHRGYKEREVDSRVGGKEAVELAIYKEGDANTVHVARAVKQRLRELDKILPENVHSQVLFDQSTFIEQAVGEVRSNAILGGLLAVLVLFLFLKQRKSTTIIGLVIPISVLATFFVMQQLGVSLNIMSLGGLALGVGMLVDNAIVVLEAIHRHRAAGKSIWDATREGASEVTRAVTASTLTTVAVFLPIIFVEGIAGQIFRDQALTVTASLLVSLVAALTLIPMLSSFGARPKFAGDGPAEAFAGAGGDAQGPGTGFGSAGSDSPDSKTLSRSSRDSAGAPGVPPHPRRRPSTSMRDEEGAGGLRGVARALARGVLFPFRLIARGLARAGHGLHRALRWVLRSMLLPALRPIGLALRFVFRWPARAVGVLFQWMGRGLRFVFRWIGRGLRFVFRWLGRGLFFLLPGVGIRAARYGVRGATWAFDLAMKPVMRVFDLGWNALARAYPRILASALDHRSRALVGALALAGIAVALLPTLGTELVPQFSQGEFSFDLELPPGTPLAVTEKRVQRVESALAGDDRIRVLFTSAGESPEWGSSDSQRRENLGQINVAIRHPGDAQEEAAVIEKVRSAMADQEDLRHTFRRPSYFSFKTPIEVDLFGYDLDELRLESARLARELSRIDGLKDVRSNMEQGSPEVQIAFRRDRMASLDLDLETVARTLRNKIHGDVATRLKERDRQLDILVRTAQASTIDMAQVQSMVVSQVEGVPIPLSTVADVNLGRGPAEITHIDQHRAAVVRANLVGRDLGSASRDIEDALRRTPPPEDMAASLGGQNREVSTSFRSLILAVCLAIFMVYIVMASQFESFLHPFVILLTVPLGLVGVIFSLAMTRTTISVVVLIGVVMLTGIVVNNAIVLVDFINQRRRAGLPKREAILEGAQARLRPIFMTTLTTVLGLTPMALGVGEGAEIRAPMAIAVIGGLLFATALTLVVIPVFYATLDRRP